MFIPELVHWARVLADYQLAGPWFGSLQHTQSSLGLDQRSPREPCPIPATTTDKKAKKTEKI